MSNSLGSLKPEKCISVAHARSLQDNWVSSRALEIENAIGAEDAREFLFSVSELQQFLDYIKNISTSEGIANPGVRVYFGAYDGESSNKATVFLVGTKGFETGAPNNYNIDPLNRGISGHPPNNY